MAETFKPGDVVRLKSGGPQMTVSRVDNGRVLCEWFADKKHEHAFFDVAVLVRDKPGPAIA